MSIIVQLKLHGLELLWIVGRIPQFIAEGKWLHDPIMSQLQPLGELYSKRSEKEHYKYKYKCPRASRFLVIMGLEKIMK